MTDRPVGGNGQDPEQLRSADEWADELGMGKSTFWLFAKRHSLPRYRVAARGKTTLFRRGDVLDAYHRPERVEPRPRPAKKAAA